METGGPRMGMDSMTVELLTGLLLGMGLACGLVLLVAAWTGWSLSLGWIRWPAAWVQSGAKARRRLAATVFVAVVVALVTRWPIAVAAAGALAWLWPSMFGGAKTSRLQLERLEAVATWTESLRDTIAGSIGLEQAITASVDVAPVAVAAPLQRLVGRLRSHVPLPQALAGFADEFDDASVDLVAAALILNARLRGPGLVGTLSALASSAREELDMRRRVEEGRKTLRRAATIIVAVTAIFAAGLVLFSRDYVQPYSTVTGQVVLALIVGVFSFGFVWIKRAAVGKDPERMLGDVDQFSATNAGEGS